MLSKKERERVAEEAIRKAEEEAYSKAATDLVFKQGGIDPKHYSCVDRASVVKLVVGLLRERDEWKERAAQHGCNIEKGDPDCG